MSALPWSPVVVNMLGETRDPAMLFVVQECSRDVHDARGTDGMRSARIIALPVPHALGKEHGLLPEWPMIIMRRLTLQNVYVSRVTLSAS
ncbi:hypothetical protein SeMB42_g05298 [Synchytrium endobioticum]|uniref:Uncharacterized protein n=1 Tax=Synchytrium endobioticum TaxID=286115 RepID=A0A507CSH6_9FUNG|nr:hypothetical protein SeMB42_g05298 [Synchytrium endobioticum]